MATTLPDVIQRYQDAHDAQDVEAALATFTAGATVHDDGQSWSTPNEIRQWLTKTSTEFTYTRALISAEQTGDGSWEVRNRLEGNFPGGVVDLRYQFELDRDRIARLTIAP
jgi:hypothetical protein